MKLTHGAGDHASPGCRRPHRITFCDESGILITEQCIQVRGGWHPLAEVTELGVARGPSGPGPIMCLVRGATLAVFGETLQVLGAGGHGLLVRTITAVLVTTLVFAALVGYLHRPHELWASCRGDWRPDPPPGTRRHSVRQGSAGDATRDERPDRPRRFARLARPRCGLGPSRSRADPPPRGIRPRSRCLGVHPRRGTRAGGPCSRESP